MNWCCDSIFIDRVNNNDTTRVNQDRGTFVKRGAIFSAALCDGAGSKKYSGIGAQAVSQAVAEYMLSNFDRFSRFELAGNIRREVCCVIRSCHKKLCAAHGANESDFASTLLSVTGNGERYISLHLGDGAILRQRNSTVSMLSFPSQGLSEKTTFLTGHPNMFENLRFFSGACGANDVFVLSTDGVHVNMRQTERLNELFSVTNDDGLLRWMGKRNTDDAAMMRIRCAAE